jgi:hypothetical protein
VARSRNVYTSSMLLWHIVAVTVKVLRFSCKLPDFPPILTKFGISRQIFIEFKSPVSKSARTDLTKVMSVLLDYESAPKKGVRLRAIPAFLVTIIKSQRHTFDRVGNYLE